MVFEEVFGVEIPKAGADGFLSPRENRELAELHVYHRPPNKEAAAMPRKLAGAQNNLQLAEGLNGAWRREQIAAMLREFLK
jgi:hypothetical protein